MLTLQDVSIETVYKTEMTFNGCIMIFNVTFSYFSTVVTISDTHKNFNTSKILFYEEFIVIKRVKLLFHLFLNLLSVIK